MIKTNVCMVALVVFFTPGCARRAVLAETPDPTNGPVYVRTGQPDLLPALLKQTVLHYGFDDATLTQHDAISLRRLADQLREQPWASIRIAGHCDERGTVEYNLALGQRRADAARSYLIKLGISPSAVESVTFGEEVRLIDSTTEEAFAENRRAEFLAAPLELFGFVVEN